MPQVLVRELDLAVVERLKQRARSHGRSLEAELREILQCAAKSGIADARELADRIRRNLSDRQHTDSTQLVQEDRAR